MFLKLRKISQAEESKEVKETALETTKWKK